MALLSVFVVGITYNLAQGRKPECHCFGQLHSAPAGWKALARNGVLAAVPIGVFSRERLPFVALRPHDASDDSREIFFLDGEGLCGEGRRQVLLKTARYACTHFTVVYYEDSGTYPPRRAIKIGRGS